MASLNERLVWTAISLKASREMIEKCQTASEELQRHADQTRSLIDESLTLIRRLPQTD